MFSSINNNIKAKEIAKEAKELIDELYRLARKNEGKDGIDSNDTAEGKEPDASDDDLTEIAERLAK